MRWFPSLCIALVLYGGYQMYAQRQVHHGPGVQVANEPVQSGTGAKAFAHQNYVIEPLADFSIQARVLSREDYSVGREAELSPLDLALGWGAMSDDQVLQQLTISQGNRFYFWRYQNPPPVPPAQIIVESANMHLIPASAEVAAEMKNAKRGDIVAFDGYLVEAKSQDGWRWKSSLTRTDTGNGACEVVWVKKFSIRPR